MKNQYPQVYENEHILVFWEGIPDKLRDLGFTNKDLWKLLSEGDKAELKKYQLYNKSARDDLFDKLDSIYTPQMDAISKIIIIERLKSAKGTKENIASDIAEKLAGKLDSSDNEAANFISALNEFVKSLTEGVTAAAPATFANPTGPTAPSSSSAASAKKTVPNKIDPNADILDGWNSSNSRIAAQLRHIGFNNQHLWRILSEDDKRTLENKHLVNKVLEKSTIAALDDVYKLHMGTIRSIIFRAKIPVTPDQKGVSEKVTVMQIADELEGKLQIGVKDGGTFSEALKKLGIKRGIKTGADMDEATPTKPSRARVKSTREVRPSIPVSGMPQMVYTVFPGLAVGNFTSNAAAAAPQTPKERRLRGTKVTIVKKDEELTSIEIKEILTQGISEKNFDKEKCDELIGKSKTLYVKWNSNIYKILKEKDVSSFYTKLARTFETANNVKQRIKTVDKLDGIFSCMFNHVPQIMLAPTSVKHIISEMRSVSPELGFIKAMVQFAYGSNSDAGAVRKVCDELMESEKKMLEDKKIREEDMHITNAYKGLSVIAERRKRINKPKLPKPDAMPPVTTTTTTTTTTSDVVPGSQSTHSNPLTYPWTPFTPWGAGQGSSFTNTVPTLPQQKNNPLLGLPTPPPTMYKSPFAHIVFPSSPNLPGPATTQGLHPFGAQIYPPSLGARAIVPQQMGQTTPVKSSSSSSSSSSGGAGTGTEANDTKWQKKMRGDKDQDAAAATPSQATSANNPPDRHLYFPGKGNPFSRKG